MISSLFKSAILALGLVGLATAPVLANQYLGGDVSVDLDTNDDVIFMASDIEATGRVGGDVLAFGADITIDAVIDGDVLTFGADIYLGGEIGSDMLAAGDTITLMSNVMGSAILAGDELRVSGFIGDDLFMAGDETVLESSAVVGSDLEIKARSFVADGQVRGEMMIEAREVFLNGVLEGEIEIWAEKVTIGPDAVITGPIRVFSPTPPTVAPEAQIGGLQHTAQDWDERRIEDLSFIIEGFVLPSLAGFGAVNAALALLVGLGVAALFPRSMARMSQQFRERPLVSTGLGLIVWATAGMILLTIMVLVALTGVGILLIPFFLIAIPIVYYLSFVFGGVVIGDRLFNRSSDRMSYWLRAVSLFVVMAVVGILSLVGEVGWFFLILSWLLVYLISFIGFGAWTLTLFNRQPKPAALEGEAV